jgi:integrase
MARTPATFALLPWPSGAVRIRKAWAAKQGTFVAVLDGPADALLRLLPERQRDPQSRRAQVTPERAITSPASFLLWLKARLPAWQTSLAGAEHQQLSLFTLKDSRQAAEAVLAGTVRASSLATYRKQFARLGRYLPDNTLLAGFNRERVQALVSDFTRAGERPAGVRVLVSALRRAMTPALDAGVVPLTVFRGVSLPRRVLRDRQPLTPAQRDKLLGASETRGQDIHLLVALGLFGGLRHAELLALTWGDVDLTAGVIRVRSSAKFTTKSGRDRAIPVCRALRTVLDRYGPEKPGAFVLRPDLPPRTSRRWHFVKTVRRVAREAGVPALTVHDLRHSFATMAAHNGVSVWKVKGWLGHASVKMTERYTAENPDFDPDIEKVG